MRRLDDHFHSGRDRCAAWLYLPDGAGPHPAVVMAHGFGAVRHAGLAAYAERFCAAGMAVLVFDYRHFGESEGEPRQLLDVGRQLEDWRAAVGYARARREVDEARVGLWGTSFSGGHVLVVAAGDPEVAAVVSQVPFVDGLVSARVTGPVVSARLAWAALRDRLQAVRGGPRHVVPIVGPPGSVACLNSPDAEPGYRAIVPEGAPWRNEVAASIALQVLTYRPITAAPRVRCPLLVCVAERDVVTPSAVALRAAERAPRAEVRRYPVGHFEIYQGEWFERAVAEQTEFLRRHLL